MSEIREKIQEINKAARRSRRVNSILWAFVIGLVALAFYLAHLASSATDRAQEQKEIALLAARVNDSLKKEAVASKQQILDVIKEADSGLWEQAKAANTIDSYAFYAKVTEGKQRNSEVKEAIELLFGEIGYVQLIDSNGSTKFFDEKVKSDLGHFFIAQGDRNVNTGVLGHSDFPGATDKRDHRIRRGQVVKVLEEYKSGEAVWAKIGYINR